MNNSVGKLTKWHEAVAKNHPTQLIKDLIFIMCDVFKYFSINIVRIMLKEKKTENCGNIHTTASWLENYFASFLLISSTLWIISDISLEALIFHSLNGKKEKKKAGEQIITAPDELRLHSYRLQLKSTG